jgi:hypothetical protein
MSKWSLTIQVEANSKEEAAVKIQEECWQWDGADIVTVMENLKEVTE